MQQRPMASVERREHGTEPPREEPHDGWSRMAAVPARWRTFTVSFGLLAVIGSSAMLAAGAEVRERALPFVVFVAGLVAIHAGAGDARQP